MEMEPMEGLEKAQFWSQVRTAKHSLYAELI
jgi:hypothetical protein